MQHKIRKVIFPVGGLGTRFLPATKSMPKEMLPVLNKPLIHHAFDEALEAGIEQFIFVIGRDKDPIINHFDHAVEIESVLGKRSDNERLSATQDFLIDPGNIVFIRQQEPLGLGHAVWCARNAIGEEPFAVMLADDMFIKDGQIGIMQDIIKHFQKDNSDNMIAITRVPLDESRKYGMVKIDSGDVISDMVEKPAISETPSNFAIVGRYVLQPSVFQYLQDTEVDKTGEIQLTNALKKMLSITKTKAYHIDALRLDCGNYLGYLEANIRVALTKSEFKGDVIEMLGKVLNKFG